MKQGQLLVASSGIILGDRVLAESARRLSNLFGLHRDSHAQFVLSAILQSKPEYLFRDWKHRERVPCNSDNGCFQFGGPGISGTLRQTMPCGISLNHSRNGLVAEFLDALGIELNGPFVLAIFLSVR